MLAAWSYWLGELESGRMQRDQMIIALINGGWANPDAAMDMQRFGNLVEVGLAFAEEQIQRGIVYSQLTTAETGIAFVDLGAQVLETVTADSSTRDTAIASIPALLDTL
jgi:hypothetical protein